MLFNIPVDNNLAKKVLEGVEFVQTEKDLLKTFGMKLVPPRSLHLYASTHLCMELKCTLMNEINIYI